MITHLIRRIADTAFAYPDLSVVQAEAGSDVQKIGDFWRAHMDTAKVEALGLTPLQAQLNAITAVSDQQLATRFGQLKLVTIWSRLPITMIMLGYRPKTSLCFAVNGWRPFLRNV